MTLILLVISVYINYKFQPKFTISHVTVLLNYLGLRYITVMMKVVRLRWVEHVICMSDSEIPKRIRSYDAGNEE